MRKGLVVPYADSRDFADLATLAEEHGWDGIFTWEALYGVDASNSPAAPVDVRSPFTKIAANAPSVASDDTISATAASFITSGYGVA